MAHIARKRFGQHFLLDLNLTRRIARAAGSLVDGTTIEIGSGPGGLTRALLALGITTVSQVAQFTPEEIERIAPLIKARADRIVRDDWVGQARLLVDD